MPQRRKKAIVLLSGGLDSSTTLYWAKRQGLKCFCLIFDYGQRHRREIELAKAIARQANCKWRLIKINLPWKGSALLDKKIKLPLGVHGQWSMVKKIPPTYVPGRNIIFLSFALSYAEAISANAVFIGANAIDYSGYPDCRPEFYHAFREIAAKGTKTGTEKKSIKIKTPLILKTKAQIIKLGCSLGVPFNLTWSCYKGDKNPCGVCDSCVLRAKGFREAGIEDPAWKQR